jgi:hypothetical protein
MQTFKPIILTAPGVLPEVAIDPLRVVTDRLFVCSNSGGGKSHATRLLIEQAGQQMPVLVIDPEGEWSSVRAGIHGMAWIGSMSRGADAPADPRLAGELVVRLLTLNCSAVLDVSDLARDEQARFVRIFLEALLNASPELLNPGRPRLVVIDEAHRFAPEDKGEAESRAAVIQLMDSGRKRGLGVVLVTQRFAKVAKSAIGECNALLIGRFASDVDQRRAADIAGFPARERGLFGEFEEGEFMASGMAFGNKGKSIRFRTNATTLTQHPKIGMQVFTPTPRTQKAVAAKFKDLRIVEPEDETELGEVTGPARTRPINEYAKLEDEVAELRGKLDKSQSDLAETRERTVAAQRSAARDRLALTKLIRLVRGTSNAAEVIVSDHDLAQDEDPEVEPEVESEAPEADVDDVAEEPDAEEPEPARAKRGKSSSSERPSGAAGRLLTTLAQAGGRPVTRRRAALLSKTTVHSSTWRTANATLTRLGYMGKSGNDLVATTAGLKAAGPVAPMPKGSALVPYWRSKLGKTAGRAVFDVLVNAKVPLLRAEVARLAGTVETSSTWRTAIAKLRGLSLVDDVENNTKLVLAKELR